MKRTNQNGFTIVEALVALVVTTLMVIVITDFMMRNIQQSTIANAKAAVLRETEVSLDLATKDVQLSANADAQNRWPDANSPGGTLNQYGWSSDSSTLILASPAQDTSGNILFFDLQHYIPQRNNIIYFVQSGTLYKRTLAAPIAGNQAKTSCPAANASASCPVDKELLHDINTFTVTYLDGQNNSVAPTDARSIELRVVVGKTAYKQNISADYKTRMVFRND